MANVLPETDTGAHSGFSELIDIGCASPLAQRRANRLGCIAAYYELSSQTKAKLKIDRTNRERRRNYLFGAGPTPDYCTDLSLPASRKRRTSCEGYERSDGYNALFSDRPKKTARFYAPGAFPEMAGESDTDMGDADVSLEWNALMSGALPSTPTSSPRKVIPISPSGTVVPGIYPRMINDYSLHDSAAQAPILREEMSQSGQGISHFNFRVGISWTDTIQKIYTARQSAHRVVETVIRTTINCVSSFKRRTARILQRSSFRRTTRRRSSSVRRISLISANTRLLSEDRPWRIRSPREEEGRELAVEHYRLAQLDIRSQLTTGPTQHISDEATSVYSSVGGNRSSVRETVVTPNGIMDQLVSDTLPSSAVREVAIRSPAPPIPSDVAAGHPVQRIKSTAPGQQEQASTNVAGPFLVTPLIPWLHRTVLADDSTLPMTQPQTKEDGRNEPLTSELPRRAPTPEDSYYEPLIPTTLDESPTPIFGPAVSAVSLVRPALQPIPRSRVESVHAREWRQMEQRRLEEERLARKTRALIEGPVVRPLSSQWEARIADIMRLPSSKQVASTLSGDPLTRRDLASCYIQGSWLNDEVINAYLAILVEYLRRIHGNAGRHDKPLFHAFSTFFFSNLRDKGYQSVRRWATRAKIGGEDLLNVDTIFIPVHNHAHWTLIVVRPFDRTIENFDSLGSVSERHISLIRAWLIGELGRHFMDEEWEVLGSESPQQTNGSDCGAFLLSTAKAVAEGIDPLSYGSEDIPLLRRKIVAEVVNGGLEGDFEPLASTL